MPTGVKELQDLVEFLNHDREILMSENKKLKELLENNPWREKYYEVISELDQIKPLQLLQSKGKNTPKRPEESKNIPKRSEESKKNPHQIRVSLKSQAVSSVTSPQSKTTTLQKVNSGNMQSKLDVTISKAYKALITCERIRSPSGKRFLSSDFSLNSSRFGTPKRSKRKQ